VRQRSGPAGSLIEAIDNNLGRKPERASADSGYCSESNLEALEAHRIDGYVAPGRAKHPTAAIAPAHSAQETPEHDGRHWDLDYPVQTKTQFVQSALAANLIQSLHELRI
jgi:hypothetical protein